MSKFFVEDLVALKRDPSITGTVACTWSDVDSQAEEGFDSCYIHKTLPSRVKKEWFLREKLLPGYVLVELISEMDGSVLVAEGSLGLVDRSLAVGDIVKRSPTDMQSGTVISTSLRCTLRPACTLDEFQTPNQTPAQCHTPSNGPKSNSLKPTFYGFPPGGGSPQSVDRQGSPQLEVPASELKHWSNYREEDFIIYKDWLGQVKYVYEEVTLRLSNGSVVTIEDSEELDEPCFLPNTASYELAQRLDRAEFYRWGSRKHGRKAETPLCVPASTGCYPGQILETKKGNLRRGKWKFGAYDPNVKPRGIVVHVRCIQLDVDWLCPNLFKPNRSEALEPLRILNIDALENGDVKVYDRGLLPNNPIASHLPHSSYSPDTGFGRLVRFKDPLGAAVQYGRSSPERDIAAELGNHHVSGQGDDASAPTAPAFDPMPRASTQGFDMNVLQVTQTLTSALVRWQDNSMTEESATSLIPDMNTDEHEVWPGDRVSYQPEEERLVEFGHEIIRITKLGIVQSVDAGERIARVRWYEDTEIDLEVSEESWDLSRSTWGHLGSIKSDVSLYEIIAYPAIGTCLGQGAIVIPDPVPSLVEADLQSWIQAYKDPGRSGVTIGAWSAMNQMFRSGFSDAFLDVVHEENVSEVFLRGAYEQFERSQHIPDRPRMTTGESTHVHDDMAWVGEIVDVCLDGQVIVRLNASTYPRDIKVPMERVVTLGHEGFEESDTDSNDSNYEDAPDWNHAVEDVEGGFNEGQDNEVSYEDIDTEGSIETMEVDIEYDGGQRLDTELEEDVWMTDEEDDPIPSSEMGHKDMDLERPAPVPLKTDPLRSKDNLSQGEEINLAPELPLFGSYVSAPPLFLALDTTTPADHHFLNTNATLRASTMRRIHKEHQILQSSLPDGVFVRSWDARLDLLRILIVGPSGTPYEHAPFMMDLQFRTPFPSSPPDMFFHSWTNGLGRINPNLYEDGKICLSLLGTWHADAKNEGWSESTSTVLQIIVSIMGLVLVKEPYYSEYKLPGYPFWPTLSRAILILYLM